ncbi:DUF3277 domain-containing protein [Bacillus cereus]|jgi:hypothetical protein|uniref:phage structural protein n=1 Tax=Bacillus cereus TaxID=1396 RepID=UPI001926F888|nr:DUF3277 domain-containing protein [Bacillus cereus]MBL3768819.1 DUF3277 domain-containing protein [Bacillus cereus]HDR4393017.1 DUF3277 domain-containing protein [Bacillus cereus]
MAVDSYDPKKVSVIVDGEFMVGFMDGTFVNCEKNEDNVIPHVGAHGDVTFAESADDTGTITITLKHTSASLPKLRKLSKEKRNFPIQVIDANDSKFKAGGNECRVLKTPSTEFGAEVSGVEVQVYVADYSAL